MDLEARFTSALSNYTSSSQLGSLWNQLAKAYGTPFRKYHNLNHLEEIFSYYDHYHHLIQNKETVVLAIFYHDFVYEVWKKNNEEESAKKAIELLQSINFPSVLLQSIEDLIICTKNHTGLSSDQNFMIDFDLAILGQSESVYKNYTQQIRKEYKIVPDLMYRKGRKKVLQYFLNKENIYQTDIFQSKYESQARINLHKELQEL